MESKFFSSEAIARYMESVSAAEHPLLADLRTEINSHPDWPMQLTALQGQFLQSLIVATGARRTLEIGVFTAFSSLAVALALPDDGTVTALDVSGEHAEIARRYWRKAGITAKIDLRVGPAMQLFNRLTEEGATFDFAFIHADVVSHTSYFEKCLALTKRGGLIAVGNTLRDDTVSYSGNQDAQTIAFFEFDANMGKEERGIGSSFQVFTA